MERLVTMTEEQSVHYRELQDLLSTEIDGSLVSVQISLSKLGKLRQVTGGFLIDAAEEAHALPENPKVEMLDQLLNEEISPDHKVVIYCQFRWEIEMLAERYKDHGVGVVYGGGGTRNLENIKRFIEDPSMRLCILHPKSAAHGITFVCAHYMIFYSISYSAEDNYQCIARIERAGQKHPMFVYYLLAKDTIDEDIYQVLARKQANQAELIDQTQADEELFAAWNRRRKQDAPKKTPKKRVTK
jgi:SNF2 family DNA or RNA helicase